MGASRPATPERDALLLEIEAGARVLVPMLWYWEVANGLLVLQRREILMPEERMSALETLAGLNITVDEELGWAAFGNTSELAEKHGLTVYDAVYLEVALQRKLGLASCDGALLAAARRCGLKTIR